MANNSSIEWTGSTWNPITGCRKISPGCKHCYAERMARRLKAMGQPNYANGFDLALHEHALELPLQWKKPQTIFVNSMSDLFLDGVPVEFIKKAFDVMNKAHWHTFQVLTKRSKRLHELSHELPWSANIWMGVSVENRDYTHRIDHLRPGRTTLTGAGLKGPEYTSESLTPLVPRPSPGPVSDRSLARPYLTRTHRAVAKRPEPVVRRAK